MELWFIERKRRKIRVLSSDKQKKNVRVGYERSANLVKQPFQDSTTKALFQPPALGSNCTEEP